MAVAVQSPRRVRTRLASVPWLPRLAMQVGLIALLLVAWQLISGRLISSLYVSSPLKVADRLWQLMDNGQLWPNAKATFSQSGLGFLIGMVAGIIIGNLMGILAVLGRIGAPFVTFFYTMPRIAIAPLFVVWLGIGFTFKTAFVAFVVVFYFITSTFAGLSSMDPDLANGIRVMGAGRWRTIRMAILPQQILWITVTFKLALPTAVATDITAEFVASQSGLGFMMNSAAGTLDTASLLAEVVFISVAVTLVIAIVTMIERKWFRWRPN